MKESELTWSLLGRRMLSSPQRSILWARESLVVRQRKPDSSAEAGYTRPRSQWSSPVMMASALSMVLSNQQGLKLVGHILES